MDTLKKCLDMKMSPLHGFCSVSLGGTDFKIFTMTSRFEEVSRSFGTDGLGPVCWKIGI